MKYLNQKNRIIENKHCFQPSEFKIIEITRRDFATSETSLYFAGFAGQAFANSGKRKI